MEKIEVQRWNGLIHRYILEKVKRGYEISCTPEEIKDFLNFISYFVNFSKSSKDYDYILNNYLNGFGSLAKDWSIREEKFIYKPMVKQTESGLIVPTYNLFYNPHEYEKTYTDELNEYYTKYMEENCSKREIPATATLDESTKKFGENVAALLLMKIWNNKKDRYQKEGKWPVQCNDIKKYLLDIDLAEIIGLPSVREALIDFYFTISKRIMLVSQNDDEFRMTDFGSCVLAKSNFDLITHGYADYPYHRIGVEDGILIERENNELQTIVDFYNGNRKIDKLNDSKVLTLVRNLNEIKSKRM